MPIDYTKYPPNWKQIRASVMTRANGLCECTGQCGSTHTMWGLPHARCDAPHHAAIIRDPTQKARWWPADDAPVTHLLAHERKVIRVVLTIAHLCQDAACGDETHMKAMCQYCHLTMDARQHARNASRTRRLQREAQGQLTLLEEKL